MSPLTFGIDATTGGPLFTPWSEGELFTTVRTEALVRPYRGREAPNPDPRVAEARLHANLVRHHLGVLPGVRAGDLASAGWAVVFPYSEPGDDHDRAVSRRRADLAPLLEHRARQAGDRFKVFAGHEGVRTSDTARDWLGRLRAPVADPVDPRIVPYYLLLAASPQEISFSFQYLLDIEYAVGRVDFWSTERGDAARVWAENLVHLEEARAPRPRRVGAFGPVTDDVTRLSRKHLVEAVIADLSPPRVQLRLDADELRETRTTPAIATRDELVAMLNDAPDVLVSGTHGLGYASPRPGDPVEANTGALICRPTSGPPAREDLFGAADLEGLRRVDGLVAMLFGCFTAGCPATGDFPSGPGRPVPRFAERPFVSRLATGLLEVGAGAVIGHVERAWDASLGARGRDGRLFVDVVARLCAGDTVGQAMELLNHRFAAYTALLATALENTRGGGFPFADGKEYTEAEVLDLWLIAYDARNFIVVGDPAARAGR